MDYLTDKNRDRLTEIVKGAQLSIDSLETSLEMDLRWTLADPYLKAYLKHSKRKLRIADREVSGGKGRVLFVGEEGFYEGSYRYDGTLRDDVTKVTTEDVLKNFQGLKPDDYHKGINRALQDAFAEDKATLQKLQKMYR